MTRLLFVDDEQALLAVLRVYFEGEGHEVRIATSAEDALALAGEEAFDAVVTDLRLGPDGEEGLRLLREVRRRDPRTRTLLLTGSIHETVLEAARASGVDAVLEKPQPLGNLDGILTGLLSEPRP
jgi:CheY-like chemotaxis protein